MPKLMRKSEVLIVGGSAVWAIETYYCRYLNELGVPTTIFNCGSYYNSSSVLHRIRMRIGDKLLYSNLNRELIIYCRQQRPTIVWVFKGVELYTETLQTLKGLGIVLVNYNPDHPFIRTSITHGGKNIPDSVPLYDLHFTYRRDLVKEIQEKFGVSSILLPFGFELSAEDFEKIRILPEINKACFIGTPDEERIEMIELLAQEGYSVDIYGRQYQNRKKLDKYKNINCFELVLGLEYWKKVREYRIQLNFFRPHNIGSHNQRTFEVPGAGGLLLTPDNLDQRNYFTESKEMFFYKDNDDLLSNVSLIIGKTTDEMNAIRMAARRRCIESEYSYQDRASIVYNAFKQFYLN